MKDQFDFDWTAKQYGVPVGTYDAVFDGASATIIKVQNPNDDGRRIRWVWRITGGKYDGQEASILNSLNLGEMSNNRKLLVALLGRVLSPGENIKQAIDGCRGKRYKVTVAIGPQGGGPAVRFVMPLQQQ